MDPLGDRDKALYNYHGQIDMPATFLPFMMAMKKAPPDSEARSMEWRDSRGTQSEPTAVMNSEISLLETRTVKKIWYATPIAGQMRYYQICWNINKLK